VRFKLGPIPTNPSFTPERGGGWVKLREPTPAMFQLLAAPVAIAGLLLVLKVWTYVLPRPISAEAVRSAVLAAGPVFLGLIPFHELVHAVCHPSWGRSKSSIYGFWPKVLLFYAHYDEEVSRRRLLVILLAPVAVLSIVPLLLAPLGVWHWMLTVVSACNVLAACGDITGALLIAIQIPSRAIVRNQGYYTWWRLSEQPSAVEQALGADETRRVL